MPLNSQLILQYYFDKVLANVLSEEKSDPHKCEEVHRAEHGSHDLV